MTYDQAERHFGSQGALQGAFHPPVPQSTVASWKARGALPRGIQFELHVLTGAKLKVDRQYLKR
jgi:hypothetical protein